SGGGSQLQHGIFAQADFTAGPAKIFAGGRHQFTGRDQTFFSPSTGIVVGRGRFRGRGTVYRSFRAPTLNELYREFRVGNAVTRANENLQPETLFGAEGGLDVVGENARMSVTLYRHSLEDLITNVTLSTDPNLIVRQRRNASAALARGVDIDAHMTWWKLYGEVAYLFADSRFSTGERIPQVPRHQGSAQITYRTDSTMASMNVRSYGGQFEDDRNRFLLPGFASVQTMLQQRLRRNLWATIAVENMLDREYIVGFSPTPLIGQPRLWRVGLRWESSL
ncbi:MAG: TonB-dependent receptor, partial [Bryobacteraceae bacterium]